MFSLALSLWAASCTSRAADDSAAFLDAMRATGNYDLTLEYLDLLSASDRTTAETRDRLPYERAVTRLEQAQTISSPSAREASVTSARRELQEFISGGNEPRLAAEASVKLAGALVNGAGRRVQAAERQSEGTQQTEAEQARRDIQDARQYLTQSEELYQQALDAFKSVQPGSPEAKQRLQLRFELAQARLANARALSELAETYQQGSAERKQTLENAAKEFASLYEKYDTPQSAGIGFYAHLYEGRCYQALGEHRLADGCFEVVASLPTDDPSLSRLVRMAQASLVAGLVAQEKPDEALQRGAEWLEDIPRKEQSQPEVLSLKHQLGEAALLAAGTTDDQGESRELLNQARSYFTAASRGFNENQSDARLRLASLNDELGASQLEAATFQEAYQVGIDALNAVFASQLAAKAGQDIDASESSKQQHNARALDAFRQALRLADSETPLTRLNDARNKLSYLFWESGDYLSSAALAEFLATKHPDDPAAEGAAKLAMASFEKLRMEAEQAGEPTDFASDHLVRLSEFITRRWAGDPLADSAFSVLLATAIRDNRLEDARRVLEGVDPERRAPLELRLALANWEQIARNGDSTATPGERSQAINELESAYQAVRERGIVNATSATGALFLAQAKLSEGHADAAAKLLEDPKLGPLTLAQQDAPAITDNAGLKAESYRTALQAYLSITPPRTADALAMMETLESAVQDKAALTRIYFGLGVQLQRQIEQLNQAGKTADAQRVSSAFAEFVSRIGDAGDDADWTMQQWMAQTYLKLGQGLDESDTEHRQEFFERARDGFQALADRAATDPSSAPSPNSGLAVRMQLGAALRGLGQYDKAIGVFAGLLAEREMMLDVQKLAAYTLQEWGDTGDAQHLQESIAGASKSPKTGKNLIWGWSKLASVSGKVARSKPEYRALFFESWLNVATSRYLAGMKASGEKKSKQLASARKTILLLSRQYSDLGGAEMRNQFDTLLKKIQRAQGEKPVGLAEFTTALLTTPEPRPTGANA